jgi:hypothetical protein
MDQSFYKWRSDEKKKKEKSRMNQSIFQIDLFFFISLRRFVSISVLIYRLFEFLSIDGITTCTCTDQVHTLMNHINCTMINVKSSFLFSCSHCVFDATTLPRHLSSMNEKNHFNQCTFVVLFLRLLSGSFLFL